MPHLQNQRHSQREFVPECRAEDSRSCCRVLTKLRQISIVPNRGFIDILNDNVNVRFTEASIWICALRIRTLGLLRKLWSPRDNITPSELNVADVSKSRPSASVLSASETAHHCSHPAQIYSRNSPIGLLLRIVGKCIFPKLSMGKVCMRLHHQHHCP